MYWIKHYHNAIVKLKKISLYVYKKRSLEAYVVWVYDYRYVIHYVLFKIRFKLSLIKLDMNDRPAVAHTIITTNKVGTDVDKQELICVQLCSINVIGLEKVGISMSLSDWIL